MSIPVTTRAELPVSSIGIESYPQSVVAKNTLWTTYLSNSYIFLKEYSGYYSNLNKQYVAKQYILTKALKTDKTVDDDRFWFWIVDNSNNLSLYELEPFTNSEPILTFQKMSIAANVQSVSVHIVDSDYVRLVILDYSNNLTCYTYSNIKNITEIPASQDLTWTATRLNSFSNFVGVDASSLQISYLDVASPPNVYLDSYLVASPTNLIATTVGDTNEIQVSWDTVTNADLYILDMDDNPSFTSPTSISQAGNTYSHFTTLAGTHYYRVRSCIGALQLQSLWSSTVSSTVTLICDFSGSPLLGISPLTVYFTDISTPPSVITSWSWDFGDGTAHSTLKNPSHTYVSTGIFTVTLTIYSGSISSSHIESSYVNVSYATVCDFIANPSIGDANLLVNFTDTSVGTEYSWLWDFGDGTPYSTVQNPTHIYDIADVYNVTLLVNGIVSRTRQVTVNLNAIINPVPPSGSPPVTINFYDASYGEPTAWLWDFGDGSTQETTQNVTHTYFNNGVYTVTLTIWRGSFTDTTTYDIDVRIDVRFRCSPTFGYTPLIVYFRDKTTCIPPATTWLWDFGDGYTSNVKNPVHMYSSVGIYTVSLTISNGTRTDVIVKTNHIRVTTFKSEIISNIMNSADIYGTPEVKNEWGTDGSQWDLVEGGKYQEMETVVEGIANALMNRSIMMDLPFNTLLKNITEYVSPDNIKLINLFGVMADDIVPIGVNDSNFNYSGNTIASVPTDEFDDSNDGITMSEPINSENPTDFSLCIGPLNRDISIEKTLWKIQAAISDRIPISANETTAGSVKKGVVVNYILNPTSDIEIKINQLLNKMKNAGWIS